MIHPHLTLDVLKDMVTSAEKTQAGEVASYIPELTHVDPDLTAMAVLPLGGECISYNNKPLPRITLQSTGKLIPLIGLLEEFGVDKVLHWIKVEPSGDDFSSITRLDRHDSKPSNPMVNAGAIALCSYIPGVGEQQFGWLEHWIKTLFNERLNINPLVFASEKRTGDRNRALAYLLQSRHNLGSSVAETLDLYFALCSYETMLEQMLYLPALLASGGRDPFTGTRVISQETCKITLAIMATCGLYDETGTYMVKSGIPAKSGVSGYIIASVPGVAGIAVLSPRVNAKGNSIRGTQMLESLSNHMHWHFALSGAANDP